MQNNNTIEIRRYSSIPNSINIYEYMVASDLSDGEFRLYSLLLTYTNNYQTVYPTMDQLGERIGKKRRRVQDLITSLESRGLIKILKNKSEKGRFENNVYIVYDDPALFIGEKKSLAPTDQSKKQVKNSNSDMQSSTSKNISCDDNNTISHENQVVKRVNKHKKDQVDEKIMDQARVIVENKLNDKEIISLLKAANNDLEKIKNYYELSKTQNVKVLVKWLVAAIKKGFDLTPSAQDQAAPAQPVKSLYNSFPQRNYTKSFYDDLESRLLRL